MARVIADPSRTWIDGPTMNTPNETHSVLVGYILWIFGFMGAHRFYFGKPITGTIWFFTAGLLLAEGDRAHAGEDEVDLIVALV